MFIIHARIVLTRNLVHVSIHRQNKVSQYASTWLARLSKMVMSPNHRHVLSFDEWITSLGEWCDGHDPSVRLALWSLQFHCYCFLHDLYMFLRLWDYAIPYERLCLPRDVLHKLRSDISIGFVPVHAQVYIVLTILSTPSL